MNNYKTKVNSEAESKEVQDLFETLGYEKGTCSLGNYPAVIVTTQDWATGGYCSTRALGLDIPAHDNYTEITLPELRDMVVLKRNDVGDATHEGKTIASKRGYLTDCGVEYFWNYQLEKWNRLSTLNFKTANLKPIEKKMKEYLDSKRNYEFVLSTEKEEGFIEIPEGMNFAYKDEFNVHFTKLEMGYRDSILVWQREQDEPFLTPETTLNDQYAEIEEVRQEEIHGNVEAEPDFNFGAAQSEGGVDATLAERQSQYGCYEDVAQVTQQILSALRIGNYDKLPAPMKESLHMIASKMARIVNGDPEYLDNWHDIGGYAKLIEKLIKGE